jgi:formamidopyrimidine-DNA glycosylase
MVERPDDLIRDRQLGPDALDDDLSVGALTERLQGTRAAIKSALMNQNLLAGVGNIYSDEILFHSRLHPKTPAGDLDRKTLRALHRNMHKVLNKAIERHARIERLPRSYLLPHRNTDGECPRCGEGLESLKVAGRTAWLCPSCQT